MMKKRFSILVLSLLVSFTSMRAQQTWMPIGENINGEVSGDISGHSVSLSADGTIVAIGEPGYLYNDNSIGKVRIFQNINSEWTQLGQTIEGETAGDNFGKSVSLSSDGSIVAIGVPCKDINAEKSGQVRVFQNINGVWTQLGQDINGNAYHELFGYNVSLSSDGSTVAVASPYYDGNSYDLGLARVYKNVNGTWTQIGQDFYGETRTDHLGSSISLNSNGSIVVIGVPGNNGNGSDAGLTRVYQDTNGVWTQIGQDIYGENIGDYSGSSVSISSDGSIVAIGEPDNSDNGTNNGKVRVFQNNNGTWTQIGQDIYGAGYLKYFGSSTGLSSDGLILAVGSPNNYAHGSYPENAGEVSVFKNENGIWVSIGRKISGQNTDDAYGRVISLNSDGSVIAIGLPFIDDNGADSGQVRVFHAPAIPAQTATQIGADIDGVSAGDKFGASVSLSSDGSIVAVGSPYNDGNGTNAGLVRVYQKINGVWVQIGQDIEGESPNDNCGYSVSISSDGSIVAIGSPKHNQRGQVRIYQYLNGIWTPIGYSIYIGTSDEFGHSVSLSSDGSIVAIGAPYAYGDSGRVHIYQNINGQWTQVGQSINGEGSDDWFGSSVSINGDGTIVAVGAVRHPNGNGAGQVRVFEYFNGTWTQIGQALDGEATMDGFGGSVSISSDGSIVAAGASNNDGNGYNSGHVRVFQNINNVWVKIGSDINGESSRDSSGKAVSLSSDGSIVAIGAPGNSENGDQSGQVRIYKYVSDVWIQMCTDIDGDMNLERSGSSVSLSSDGNTVAIGVPNYSSNNIIGRVRVYEISNFPAITGQPDNHSNICQGSNVSYSIAGYNLDSFQWQESTDNGNTWSDIANGGIYSGATTETLNITGVTLGMNNYQYHCIASNSNGFVVSDVASLITDNEPPTITCLNNQTIDLNQGETFYTVSGTEFDPLATGDNCNIASVINNFNNTNTLAGEEIPIGTTSIEWIVTDEAGNETSCSFDIIVNDYASDIKDLQQRGIAIYPNPTNSIVTINFSSFEDQENRKIIKLQDVTGKLIYQFSINTGQLQVDLSDLNNGIYFIRIEMDKAYYTTKIIKK